MHDLTKTTFPNNQDLTNITFQPQPRPWPGFQSAPRPPILAIQPHNIRGLPPNTPARRLFGEIQNPDTPFPTTEKDFDDRLPTPTPSDSQQPNSTPNTSIATTRIISDRVNSKAFNN